MFVPPIAKPLAKASTQPSGQPAKRRSGLAAQFKGGADDRATVLQYRSDPALFRSQTSEPGVNAHDQEARRLDDQGPIPHGRGAEPSSAPGFTFGRLPIQAKLTVGEPGDKLEEEADKVADRVMRLPDPTVGSVLQRKCAACEEDKVQRKTVGASVGETAVPPIVHDVLRSPGQPLDTATRAFMELQFGHDFARVRVHTDARACESARAVNALAYTVGSHIVLPGKNYAPHGIPGRRLLAHELTHVIQQGHSAELGGAATASAPEASRRAMVGVPNAARVPALQRKTVCDEQGVCHTEDDITSPASEAPPAEADWHAPMADPKAAPSASTTPTPKAEWHAPMADPNAAPNASVADPNAAPNASVADPNAAPNASVADPNAAPNASVADPNAAPSASVAGPNTTAADPNATTPSAAGASVPSSGGHIYFDQNQAVLRPDAISAIDTYGAQYLASAADTDITVMGWASVEGPTDHNNNLSISRATAVKNELVAQGVSDAHVSVGAGGATSQFSSDLAPNRRVEITPPQSGKSSRPKCPLPEPLPTIAIASIASELPYKGTASVDYRVQGIGTGPGVVFYPKVETGGDHIVVPSAPYLPDKMRADNATGTFHVQAVTMGRTRIAMSVTDPCNATAVSNFIPFSVVSLKTSLLHSAEYGFNFTLTPLYGMDGGEHVGGGVIVYELKEDWPNGRTAKLAFTGGGGTEGTPVVITGPGSSSSFTTPKPMRIEDFEGSGRITSGSAYLPILPPFGVGGGYASLTFGNNGVQVTGFGVGTGAGAGVSIYLGHWDRVDNIRDWSRQDNDN
jgi:outer membrane protein OmpA-like peptidoglycan-associated protein